MNHYKRKCCCGASIELSTNDEDAWSLFVNDKLPEWIVDHEYCLIIYHEDFRRKLAILNTPREGRLRQVKNLLKETARANLIPNSIPSECYICKEVVLAEKGLKLRNPLTNENYIVHLKIDECERRLEENGAY